MTFKLARVDDDDGLAWPFGRRTEEPTTVFETINRSQLELYLTVYLLFPSSKLSEEKEKRRKERELEREIENKRFDNISRQA